MNTLPAHARPSPALGSAEVERWTFDQLLGRAFESCGFRKAYIEFVEWSPPRLDDGWKAVQEASLSDAIYHEGRYWDAGVTTITNPLAGR